LLKVALNTIAHYYFTLYFSTWHLICIFLFFGFFGGFFYSFLCIFPSSW
jgi:hypothetical protein